MKNIMCYSDFQVELLQNMFRHKLVHTAEPISLYKKKGEVYSWSCYSNNREKHLKCTMLDRDAHANNFSISIWSLVEDIENSVHKANGYLNMVLKNQKGLFDSFSRVFERINFEI